MWRELPTFEKILPKFGIRVEFTEHYLLDTSIYKPSNYLKSNLYGYR